MIRRFRPPINETRSVGLEPVFAHAGPHRGSFIPYQTDLESIDRHTPDPSNGNMRVCQINNLSNFGLRVGISF